MGTPRIWLELATGFKPLPRALRMGTKKMTKITKNASFIFLVMSSSVISSSTQRRFVSPGVLGPEQY
jgi:hypothetical protein